RIGARVGAGGMSEVYEGWDTRTDRRVAIKVLSDEGVDAARRLKREAHHALKLAHPNICEVYEVVDDEAGAFIAMEFFDGRGVADPIPECGSQPPDAIDLALRLPEAIAPAHELGIIP